MSTKSIRNSTFCYLTAIAFLILMGFNVQAQELESITLNFGAIGDTVNITVVGNQTNFAQQDGIIDMYIESELVLIFASAINTINDTLAIGQFILDTEDCGNVDFVMETALDGFLVIPSGFRILCDRDKDSLALVDLYNECNGANWDDTTNWLTGPLDTWYGVTALPGDGRVTALDLSGTVGDKFGLNGSFPTSFDNLDQLISCNFAHNNLSAIFLSGISELIEFDCSDNQISFLQLDGLPQFLDLNAADNNLSNIILSGLPFLDTINLSNNQFISLNLTEFSNLKAIIIDNNLLGSLDLSAMNSLEIISCIGNEITSLFLPDSSTIVEVYCGFNQLINFDITNQISLVSLSCQNNDIDALDFTGTPNLIELNCSSNNLASIDVSGLVSLEVLDCSNNQLSKLDLRNSPFINDIDCDSNEIYEFKIDGLDLITSLSCAHNKLQSLSINGIDELSTLRCNNNQIPLELLTFIRFQPSYDPNTYVLTPQNNSEAIYYLEFDLGETLNYSEGNVESFTQYRWNKVDGDTITTFDPKGQLILDFTDTTMAGDYYFESINEDFPGDTVLGPIYRIAVNDTLSDNLSVVTIGELIIDLGPDPTPTTDSIINYLVESGAYVIDSCVCGGPKLWEIPDTVYVGLNKYLNFNAVKTWGKTELDAEGGSADFNYEWGDNLPSNDDFPYTYSVPYKNYGSNDDVLLSIIDQGIDMTHPDLLNWVWNPIGTNCGIAYSTVYSGYLFSDSSTIASGLSEPIDDSGHGTGVAGIVPQAANASANIDIFNERISGVGESATLFKAICAINSAIVEEASVVNMSLGYWGNRSDIFEGIIQDAADANIIIVVSAGNDSMDLQPYVGQDYGFFPANYTRNEFPNLITTGGYDKNMAPVDFSNFCAECVDVAGPSKNMRSSKFNTQTFDWFSGTSFTSPYVSGIIASIYAGLGKNTPYFAIIDTFFNDFTKDSTLYTNLVKDERILDVSAKYLCDYQPITVDDEVYDTNVVQITIDPTTNDCIAIPCSSELTIVQNGQMGTADVIGTSNIIEYFITSADTIIKDTIIYQFCYLSCPQAEVECGTAYIFIDVKNHTPYEITILDSSCNPADTGTVIQNLIATIGVDSIITTITSLLPSDSVTISAESCDPNEVGTEIVTLTNQYGCDSVVTITTSLLKSDSVILTAESCDPNEVGTAIVTLTNQYGCDSVVTIITSLLPSDSVTLTAESCDPNEVGTETVTLTNQYGCDSVVTTITSLLPSYTITIDATSCDPNEVGVETELFTSVYGCDSVVVTNTTLLSSDSVTITAESCDPNEVGSESVTLINQAGCDSVVTTITSLIPSYSITIDATSCNPNDVGVVTEVLTSVYGCDSIVITNTTLTQGDAITIEAESCDSNEVGTEIVTLTNQAGCDSVVTTITSLIPSYAITIDATSCDPNDVGTVTGLFTSVYGCDSIVTIITTLLPSDAVTIETESCDPDEVGTETVILFNQYGCDSIVSIVTVLAADCEECITPDNLYATNITFTQATLGWDEVEGALRYQAEGRLKNSIFGLTKKRIVQDNIFRTNNLFPFLTYQFRVRTDCSDGWTPWSYWYDFTLNPFLNLNINPNLSIVSKDIEKVDLFDVDQIFVVSADVNTKMIYTYYFGEELTGGSIMITDLSGRILSQSDFDLSPNNIKSIQLSKELANGIYFVSLIKDDLVLEVEKIILQ